MTVTDIKTKTDYTLADLRSLGLSAALVNPATAYRKH